MDVQVVGEHGGRSLMGKGVAVLRRAWRLSDLARPVRVDVAVSFNSYAQGLAARRLGVPFVTVMDYEHQPANHLAFRLAQRVVVPEGFERAALVRHGAREDRVRFHSGLKEHVAVADFRPDPDFPRQLEALGIAPSDVLVTMRPPATWSTYHRFENDFFEDVLLHVARQPGVKIVALPRYESQAQRLRALGLANVVVPPMVLDGLNLVAWSDLVVSAGGSMNREAVVLGTPAWTVFGGRMAGVDRRLIADGVLRSVQSPEDLHDLPVTKKTPAGSRPRAEPAPIESILSVVLDAAGS
jgi:predicted glycosyltransferase